MLLRLPLAFVLGLVIYLIAAMMTVYDGVLSLIFQPIAGSIYTMLALLALCIAGSPLLFLPRVWRQWQRVGWFTLLFTLVGIGALIVSWHPALRVQVLDPETQAMRDSFHPALSIGGWLLAMFGVMFCPAIGFRGDRRWM